MFKCTWTTFEGFIGPEKKTGYKNHEGILINIFEDNNGDTCAAVLEKDEYSRLSKNVSIIRLLETDLKVETLFKPEGTGT